MPRDDSGVSFIKSSGFLKGTDGLFASHKPPTTSLGGTVWQDNTGPHSRRDIPSLRLGGRALMQVPTLQRMPKRDVGAFAAMPEDPKRSVHAFAYRNGYVDVHYKDEHGVHTKLSPRTVQNMMTQAPQVFREIIGNARQPTAALDWDDTDSNHDDDERDSFW